MPEQKDALQPPHRLDASADGDYSASLNARRDGWNSAMGLHFLRATGDEVIAELEIAMCHLQAYGIVHGGVYSGIIETVTSVAAALWAGKKNNQSVVGLENHTSFLNAVREGTLRVCGAAVDAWTENAGLGRRGDRCRRTARGRRQGAFSRIGARFSAGR